ncbi:hypothetical protein MBGDN05_00779 [Thermoplasmatales archaeon SCGC AB-539-N05]|nr:hypothetical protein MBGDN05_00779 [Thermoplasmatales archaeon SCGC AB-539-N05]
MKNSLLKKSLVLEIALLVLVIGIAPLFHAGMIRNSQKSLASVKNMALTVGNDETDVPTWNVGNSWTFDIDLSARAEKPDLQITSDVGCNNLPFTVVDDIDDAYRVEFNGNIYGSFFLKVENFPALSGSLKDTTVDGHLLIKKTNLGIKEYYVKMEGKLMWGIIPNSLDAELSATFDPPFSILDFPISVGKTWTIMRSNVTYDGIISLPGITKLIPWLPEELVIDRTDIAGGDSVECISKEEVNVAPGPFSAYVIVSERWEGTFTYYYAPVAGNIIKITSSEYKFDIFDLELNYELKSLTYTMPGAPEIPSRPNGPTQGTPDVEYTYSSLTIDHEGDQVYYWFDWGDGTDSDWLGPYDSGQQVSAPHTWSERGSYAIKVKAKDVEDHETLWSSPLSVSLPKNKNSKAINNPLFLQFLERFPMLKDLLGL